MGADNRGRYAAIIATISLVVAIASLLVAYVAKRESREATMRNARPHIELITVRVSRAGTEFFLQNQGPGIARIEWFEAIIGDKRFKTWESLILSAELNGNFEYLDPAGRTMAPGSRLVLLHANDAPTSESLRSRLENLKTRYCFCSAFGECWIQRDIDYPGRRSFCAATRD